MSKSAPAASVRFIPDQAADEDFFGSHQPIANAIVATIQHSDVKMVGLLGRWGSGKSTVIKLVEKALKKAKKPKYHVFTYDAWLHQSDPHRRSFLDQLVAFAEAEKLGSEEQWRESLDLLHRRIEITDIDSTPTLTSAGRLLVIALLLLPIGLAFSSRQWYDAWTASTVGTLAFWIYLLGITLTAGPALIALLIYLAWRPCRAPYRKAFWASANFLQHRHPNEDQSILAIIANKHVQKQQNKLTKTPEPSAIEFQTTFRTILKDIGSPERRLVIVVDNLDRLAQGEALEMWSTIRSFFLGAIPAKEQLDRHELPTVILPIDESAVKRAKGAGSEDDEDILARSFMDKTFDVLFHVSPPVLSNWGAYLDKQMKFSFGSSMQKGWLFQTKRIYRHKADSSGAVTPRDINKTVSAILALWLQWRSSEIPFVSIAYYAVYRSHIEKDLARALSNPLVEISERDPNWQRSLAALYYGIKPEDAIQVLLDQPLRTALQNRNSEWFKRYMPFPGFAQAFERVLDAPSFVDADIIVNTAAILAEANPEQSDWLDFAWRRLRNKFTVGDLWSEFGIRISGTAQLLISNCPPGDLHDFLSVLVGHMAAWPDPQYKDAKFTDMAAALVKLVHQTAAENEIKLNSFIVQADDEGYLELAAQLIGSPGALKFAKPKSADTLPDSLGTQVQSPDSRERIAEKARAVLILCSKDACDPLRKAAVAAVQSAGSAAPVSAWIIGELLASNDQAKADLKQLAAGGQLQALLNDRIGVGDWATAGMAAALFILADHPVGLANAQPWSKFIQEHPEFLGLVDERIQEWRDPAFFELLVHQRDHDQGTTALIGPIAEACAIREDLGTLPVKAIVHDPGRYYDFMNEKAAASFIMQLPGYQNFWTRLEEEKLSSGAIRIVSFLMDAGGVPPDLKREARKALLAQLKAVPAATWQAAVQGNQEPLNIALKLVKSTGRPVALGMPLFDSLNQLMAELIASEARPYAAAWFSAAKLLSKSHRNTLMKNMRDHLLGIAPPPNLYQLLAAGGAALLEEGEFASKADESVRHIVIPGMAPEGLAWLMENEAMVSSWLVLAAAETRQVAKERAEAQLATLEGEHRTRLELLSKSWSA